METGLHERDRAGVQFLSTEEWAWVSSCWDHHYIAPRICSGSVKCQVRAFRGSPNPKLQTLIRREYEQKVCFETAKTVGKAKTKQNETLLGSSFSRFFFFFAIGSKSRSRSASAVDAFYGSQWAKKTAGPSDCLILNGYPRPRPRHLACVTMAAWSPRDLLGPRSLVPKSGWLSSRASRFSYIHMYLQPAR